MGKGLDGGRGWGGEWGRKKYFDGQKKSTGPGTELDLGKEQLKYLDRLEEICRRVAPEPFLPAEGGQKGSYAYILYTN